MKIISKVSSFVFGFMFTLMLSACGGGGEGGVADVEDFNDPVITTPDSSGNTGSTGTDVNSPDSGATSGSNSGVAFSGFSLQCDEGTGLVGCWVTPCVEMDAVNHIYAQQMVSFRSNGAIEKSTVSHLNNATCTSSNSIEVKDNLQRNYMLGDPFLTDSGVWATEMITTQQSYYGSTTFYNRITIVIVNESTGELYFPDSDYNWDITSHPGVTFGVTNPSVMGTDVDYNHPLSKVVF